MRNYIDIDIRKSEIYYHYQTSEKVVADKFTNTAEAIREFIEKLPADSYFVIEATGVYHFPLCFALSDTQKAFTILNPLDILHIELTFL